MRILIVLHQFFPEFSGGTERVALNLARTAQRAGHHVRVLACAVQPGACDGLAASGLPGAFDTVHDGVPITLLPRAALPVTADYSFDIAPVWVDPLQSWMQEQRFDMLHLLHPMRMATAIKAAQQCGLPYVLTLTDFFLPCNRINLVNLRGQQCDGPQQGQRCAKDCKVPPWDAESLAQRHRQAAAVLASASVCVAPSAYVADRYRAAFDGLQVQVIPHGIDLLALLRHAASPAMPPAGARPLTLGYIGTIVPQKGLQVLLQALAAIPDAPLRLMVAGGLHGDVAYADSIHRMVAADPRVQLLGQLDAVGVGAMLGSIDLLCLPSIVPESFSLVLRESAALGVPALVSNLGAPAELMAETGAGLALPAGDPAAWAQAIAQVQSDPAVLERWRAALPLPLRVEEETFLYESLYRQFRKAG
ncbi:MAG: glycosyltransferase [Alicycliphilus sp.]|nr:glycosyltransferase [Alicycliphilus sp.]MBP7606678.1 glycosyltransferase [Giesbergeria sp.]MBP8204499.1 glycosyltransferase [Giesbergeria sp.]